MKTIRTISLFLFAFYFAFSAYAITASKAYVDGATNATLAAAKAYADTATNDTLSAAKTYTDAAVVAAGAVTPKTVTNIVDAKIAAIPKDGVSTTAVNFIIGEAVRTNYLCTVAAAQTMANNRLPADYNSTEGKWHIDKRVEIESGAQIKSEYVVVKGWAGFASSHEGNNLPDYLNSLAWRTTGNRLLSNYGITNAYTKAEADAAYYPKSSGNQLANNVSAISSHLSAEDARFVSTNYDNSAKLPEAYVEIKVSNNWLTVWREMSRWTNWTGSAWSWSGWQGFGGWRAGVETQLSNKAERAWGVYDSEKGTYSPDGFTQISSSNVLLAAGMSYERVVTTGQSVWVLQCNQGTAHIGGDTNGYFRIRDGEGNAQFEIVKGNRVALGADADGITVAQSGGASVVTIHYSVDAAEHPTLVGCTNIAAAVWHGESEAGFPASSVVWSGASNSWQAVVTVPSSYPAAFFQASYLGGSETIIRNIAPVQMSSIIVGGTKYTLGTATISGHTVLTLTPAN